MSAMATCKYNVQLIYTMVQTNKQAQFCINNNNTTITIQYDLQDNNYTL